MTHQRKTDMPIDDIVQLIDVIQRLSYLIPIC